MSGHTCPAPGCTAHVVRSKLACARHWAKVPAKLQRELYAAWDRGRGAGTGRHMAAVSDVLDYLEGVEP